MANKAAQRYPLSHGEEHMLKRVMMGSSALMLVVGVLVALLGSWLTDDVDREALLYAWVPELGAVLTPHVLMVVAPVVLFVLFSLCDLVCGRFLPSYRAEIMDARQGFNGELPRVSLWFMVPMLLAVGFTEELVFRYGAFGILLACAQVFMPRAGAIVVALVLSCLLFTLAHTQYAGPWALSQVSIIGVILVLLYLYTGSLLVCALTHALYDILDIVSERILMVRNPDYFGGKVPVDEFMRMMQKANDTRADKNNRK